MLWPAGRNDVIGYTPLRFIGNTGILSSLPMAGTRFNVYTGETWSQLAARPPGYYIGGSYALPYVAGDMGGITAIELASAANIAAGINISGSSVISLASSAAISAVAGLSGSSIITMSSSGIIGGIADMSGSSTITLTATGSIGGIASMSGASVITITASGQTNAMGFMVAAPIDASLSPDTIAEAVWARIGGNGQTYGATLTSAEKWAKLAAALSA